MNLSPDEVLTTTRAVRKRLDYDRPVDPELIKQCLTIAVQAPSGSNRQGWQFVVIGDPDVRARVSALYRESFASTRQRRPPAVARRPNSAATTFAARRSTWPTRCTALRTC